MTSRRARARTLTLVLLSQGGAELLDGSRQLWASDSDEDFQEAFPDELLPSDDETIVSVLDYLVDAGLLSDDEADDAAVQVETLEAPSDEDDTGDDEPDAIDP